MLTSRSDLFPSDPELDGLTCKTSLPLWTPFPTLEAFKQAELFILNDCADPMIDAQLTLIHDMAGGSDYRMFKNAREMHKLLAQGAVDEDLTGVS
jgi:hypothetical protein